MDKFGMQIHAHLWAANVLFALPHLCLKCQHLLSKPCLISFLVGAWCVKMLAWCEWEYLS